MQAMKPDIDRRIIDPGASLPAVCPYSGLAIRTDADWVYRNPQGSYETSFALIGRRIILVTAKGYVEETDMQHAIALADAVKTEVFPPGARYASIENFTLARGGTMTARRGYLAYTNQLKGLQGSFVFGLPPFFRLSFNLTRRLGLHRHKVHVVADYAAAIQAAVALTGEDVASTPPRKGFVGYSRGGWPPPSAPDGDRRRAQPLPLRPVPSEALYRDQVNHLLDFLGGIDPEKPGIQRRRKYDGGPQSAMEPVYEAIELMKHDMDFLVDEQQRMLRALSDQRDELQRKSVELERQNLDLRRLLQENAEDSRELEAGVVRNAHRILKPLILAMRKNGSHAGQVVLLDRLAGRVDELLAAFTPRLDSLRFSLTPQELRVARLIRHGLASRQIAARLGIATRTVTTHRMQIRQKLGLKGRRRNLRTYLLSIPDGALAAGGRDQTDAGNEFQD
jgi:DNA-binding CsgD family transcriptional regulator